MQPAIPSDLDVLAGPESPVLAAADSSNGIPIAMPETPEMSEASDKSEMSEMSEMSDRCQRCRCTGTKSAGDSR